MHLSLLHSEQPIVTSPIHRLSPGIKVGAALALVVLTVSAPLQYEWCLSLIAILVIAIAAVSRIFVRFLLLRLLMLEPFALGVAILSLFQPGGWRIFLLVLSKCTICFITTIILGATTPISQLIQVLRAARVSSLLITTMLLMHRYLFVLIDESQRMKRARSSRTFVKRRRFEWRGIATLIGQLFIRSAERADRVYAAMCARGWQ